MLRILVHPLNSVGCYYIGIPEFKFHEIFIYATKMTSYINFRTFFKISRFEGVGGSAIPMLMDVICEWHCVLNLFVLTFLARAHGTIPSLIVVLVAISWVLWSPLKDLFESSRISMDLKVQSSSLMTPQNMTQNNYL